MNRNSTSKPGGRPPAVRLLLSGVLALMGLAGSGNPTRAADRQPNIVVLLADDLGYGELGCQGNPEIPTPNIDSIAEDGVRFTNGYVTAPFCSASRAGLLTGRYQTRFGYEFNPTGAHNENPDAGLPPGQRTLADVLHNAGYTTGLIGKWHLGGTARYHPYRRGFDEFFGFMHEGHYFVPPPYHAVTTMLRRKTLPGQGTGRWQSADGRMIYSTHMGYSEPDYDADNPIYRGGQPVEVQEYLTDAFTREAVDFIHRNADRPFFLYLAWNAMHSPLQGADRYIQQFSSIEDIHRRIFAAMLSNLDDSTGDVLTALRNNDLESRTLVFFLSDNGGPTRELTSSNAPLRGEKGTMYEGGIRIPFLARWPGRFPAGLVEDRAVISLDIFATAVSAAGADLPNNTDGVDLTPFLNGSREGNPHESLYWRTGRRTAVRAGDWKLLKNPVRGQQREWQLYHLKSDPAESDDLAGTHPELRQQLIEVWNHYNDQMMEPIWRPR